MNEVGPNAKEGADQSESAVDPLTRYPRTAALLVGLMAAGLFAASLLGDTEPGLPTLAFDWQFGLDLIRAAVAFVIVALILLLVIRGWNGVWPQRFSHEGLDYSDALKGSAEQQIGLKEASELLDQIRERTSS
jgi:hypothetical protein